ncbi:hypothetical protein F5883DRAFT_651637 [Diaporthe sp. PMI_573]|nr:hypothetical protein F5883DRAFT_651637 [Diaporthaceae sp. PMI_573]
MAAAPGPLPDFDTMGQAFNSIQVQFQRFANVPAMQDGQLLQILVQQNQQILQRLDGLTERVDGLTERVDSLSAKIDIMKIRASAETPERLELLYNTTTNEPIDNFPDTVEGIQALNMANANRILVALGHEPRGSLPQKKRRILLEAGITQQLTNI